MLKPLGINFKIFKPKIFLSENEKNEARLSLINAGISTENPIVMISAIGSEEIKTYPLPYLAKVINEIALVDNIQILLNYIPFQRKEVEKLYSWKISRIAIKPYYRYVIHLIIKYYLICQNHLRWPVLKIYSVR